MAFAPITFVATNYRDYKNWWLKAYEPGTTTPKPMSDNDTGSPQAAKYEIDKDGWPVTAGSAIVNPHIDGDYDIWLFPTEADADANDTTNALRLADDLSSPGSSIGGYASYEFDTVVDAQNGITIGGQSVILKEGDVIRIEERDDALFDVIAGTGTANGFNIISHGTLSLSFVLRGTSPVTTGQWGVSGSATADFNRDALQELFNSVSNNDVVHNLQVSVSKNASNPYCISMTQDNVTIRGNGRLTYTGGGAQLFRVENCNNFEWTGVELIGDGLDGTDTGYGLLQVTGGSNIYLHDFRVADSDSDGAVVASASGVRMIRINTSNCSKSGVYVNNSSDVEINGCTPSGGGGQTVGGLPVGAAIQSSGNTRTTISDNQIQNYVGIGILCDDGINKPYITNIHDNIIQNVSNAGNVNVEGGIVCTNGNADKQTLTTLHNNKCFEVRANPYKFENHNGLISDNDKTYLSDEGCLSIGTCDGVRVYNFGGFNGGQTSSSEDIVLINDCDDALIVEPRLEDLPNYTAGTNNHRAVDSSTGSNRIEYRPVEYSIAWQPNGGAAIAANTTVDTAGSDIPASGLDRDNEITVIPPVNLNGLIASAYIPGSLGQIRIQLSNNTGASRTIATTDTWRVITRRFQQS